MKKSFFFLLLFSAIRSQAQDAHFTQLDKTISYLNPAMTGNFDGFAKITAQHRSQWINTGTAFTTSYMMGEMNFGKKKKGIKSYAGLGAYFLNDVAGASKIGLRTGGISASGNVPLSVNQWISGGINLSFNQRVIDLSNVTFLSQWDGTTLNPNQNSGENLNYSNDLYPDAGMGMAFNFQESSDEAFNSKNFKFQAGISFQHLNRPKMNFTSLEQDRLAVKTLIHAHSSFGVTSVSNIELTVAQFFQGPHKETLIGTFLKTKLKEASHFTSLVSAQYLTFGTYFRTTMDICPYFALDLGPFRMGIAYDLNFRNVTRDSYRHSFEIQLAYLFSKWNTLKF
ncbi:MAG: PorP/SprF family type IX secretion system membrane protein [Crocinitomicaceae bacterium]